LMPSPTAKRLHLIPSTREANNTVNRLNEAESRTHCHLTLRPLCGRMIARRNHVTYQSVIKKYNGKSISHLPRDSQACQQAWYWCSLAERECLKAYAAAVETDGSAMGMPVRTHRLYKFYQPQNIRQPPNKSTIIDWTSSLIRSDIHVECKRTNDR
jgi:hypothetical protein